MYDIMSHNKARTSISIPTDLLKALDNRAREEGRTRSDLVCEAVNLYFAGEEERLLAEGYIEMAEESLEMAEAFLPAALEVWPEW